MSAVQGELRLPEMKGREVSPGIVLMAEPTPVPNSNTLRCLADVHGMLAIVELTLRFRRGQ